MVALCFLMLAEQRVRIQGLVARSVVLKYTPILRFVADDSALRGNRVLEIIEELEKNSPAEPTQGLDAGKALRDSDEGSQKDS